jgi:mono/diheme cytochrome c family protein
MSENKTSKQLEREKPDPLEGDKPWPLYVWIFIMLMVSWSTTYFALYSGDGNIAGGDQRIEEVKKEISTSTEQDDTVSKIKSLEDQIKDGVKVYASACQACHQSNGNGLSGAFPPLVKSSWVLGDPIRPIKFILHGLQGEIEVLGVTYNGVMPAHKEQFNDQQIADVTTYIRNTWGNKADAVKASLVKELREEFKDRADAWTVKELN